MLSRLLYVFVYISCNLASETKFQINYSYLFKFTAYALHSIYVVHLFSALLRYGDVRYRCVQLALQ